MNKEEVLKRIKSEKLIAVVRMSEDQEIIRQTLEALAAGRVSVIEITTNVPGAVELVAFLASRPGREFLVGAGTVLDTLTAEAMIEAGAEFIVSPGIVEEVIACAKMAGVTVFPGALTPSEIMKAYALGADAVKVFPASLMGPSYIRALKGPLPHIPLIPTGGLDLGNIAEYIRAGAFALGVGGNLLDINAIRNEDWQAVTATAAAYVNVAKGKRFAGSSGEVG